MVTKNLDDFQKKWISGQKTAFLARNSAFFYATPMKPPFFGSDAPDRTDHMSTISWGNSGYLRFSGRWPFGRSAGRFSAPIAQSGPFGAQKRCFRPKINFLCTSSNFFVTIMTRHQKDNVFVLLMLLSKLQGGCKSPFWPKNGPKIWFLCFSLYFMASYGNAWICYALYLMVLHSFACHCIVLYTWYCMVLYYILRYCIVGFNARAVSRKTPIYFI